MKSYVSFGTKPGFCKLYSSLPATDYFKIRIWFALTVLKLMNNKSKVFQKTSRHYTIFVNYGNYVSKLSIMY